MLAARNFLEDATLPSAEQHIGAFRIEGVLGSGGMGVVFRATGPDGQQAAIKIISSPPEGVILRRFKREAEIRIDHPNVARILEAEVHEGVPYIAFELLEGASLDEHLRGRSLAPAEAVDVALQALRGLMAAHDLGVVHRDIKPANIFRCRDGTIKLLDFGIAHWAARETRLTASGMIMGSPAYLSPEQARGDLAIDARADVWGLGAVLYHALSGAPPFERETVMETLLATAMSPLVPLSARAAQVPRELARIIDRALAKPREDRWPNARAMYEALLALDLHAAPSAVFTVDDASAAPTLGATPPTRSPKSREKRIVAVLLATHVRDLNAIECAVRERGGLPIPLAGGRVIGLFGWERWTGDELHQAALAAVAGRVSAGRVAVAQGHVMDDGRELSGTALRSAELCCEAALAGVAVDSEAARRLGEVAILAPAGPGVFELAADQSSSSDLQFPRDHSRAPLVGRDAERSQIERALRVTLEEETPVLMLVVGPPGIGKSRLRQEASRLFDLVGRGASPRVRLLARAQPCQQRAAFSLLKCALEAYAYDRRAGMGWPRLTPEAPLGERQHAVLALAQEAFADKERARQSAEFLGELLGAPMPESPRLLAARRDPQMMADHLRLALGDYLEGLATTRRLGLLVEDLQWADEGSLSLISEIVDRASGVPLFLFATARPEFDPSSCDLFAGHEVTRIDLQGLTTVEVAELARSIGDREPPDALVRALFARTGGNPLFVEQIMLAMSERDLSSETPERLPLPLTVEAAVQARLDALPTADKETIKRAAILERPFLLEEIEALGVDDAEARLMSLVRRNLLRARSSGRPISAPAREYSFRSALVAEVAGRMIAPELCRELHGRMAVHLESRPSYDPEELARHHHQAGAIDLAGRFYAEAVLHHARRCDGVRVLDCASSSMALGCPGEMRFAVHMARSEAFHFLGRHQEQDAALEEAEAAASSQDQRSRALIERAKWTLRGDTPSAAVCLAERAVEAAEAGRNVEVRALALGALGFALTAAARFGEAEEALSRAVRLTERSSVHVRALVTSWEAQLATQIGDLGKRRAAFAAARELYAKAGDIRRAAGAAVNLADVYNRMGAYADAVAELRTALDDCRRVGNRPMEGYALANLGYALTMLGSTEEASSVLDEADRSARKMTDARLRVLVGLYRSRTRLLLGCSREVEREAVAIARGAEERGLSSHGASAWTLASRAALALGDEALALEYSTRAMKLRDELRAVEEDEAEIFVAHARALAASRRVPEARDTIARGRRRLDEIAGSLPDDGTRAGFLLSVFAHREIFSFEP